MSAEKKSTPVALVGIGCLFPKAPDLRTYWNNIREKVDAITEVPESHWRPEDYFHADQKVPDMTYGRRGGFLSPAAFDCSEFGLSPNNVTATDPAQLLGLVTAYEALKDAGYGPEKKFDRRKVSVILGVTGTLETAIPLGARLGHPIWRKALGEAGITGEQADFIVKRIADSYVGWQENSFPGLLGNVVAGRIANRLDLGGTNCVVDAACASSLSAAHLGLMELETGRADMVVSGGVDTFNDIFMYMCFSKTPALSPTGDSRPFDAQGDGTILGEGIGMVVYKRLADAERDGDRIYAVLKGIGSSSDGKGKAIYAPSQEGQVKALTAAYEMAGVTPETIELVEAHGTGTKVGDATEIRALTEVYRPAKEGTWVALGSVKSQIGHTKAAAGTAGLIKAAMALHHKVLPPTIKIRQPLPEAASGSTPFYANTEKRPWLPSSGPRRAAVSAFGFGGSNFHAVLEEYRPEMPADWDGAVQIAAFSGATPEAVKQKAAAFPRGLSWDDVRVKAMESRRDFRLADASRLLVVIEQGKDYAKTLNGADEALGRNAGKAAWSTPDGAYYGSGAAQGKLGFLFPGQGSQYVGMLRDVACQFPQAHGALALADRALGGRLSDVIYPHPAFDDATKAEQEARLKATTEAQPAIGAAALGALGILSDLGVRPEAAAGHSYGELVALCAAGVFDRESLIRLSRLRGQLMVAGGGDKGTMLAVQAPIDDVRKAVETEGLNVTLANKNAPKQVVLSGSKDEIRRAAQVFEQKGMKAVPLPVAAAFHSPLVADAKGPFREALGKVAFDAPAFPVYANTTAEAYPAQADAMRDLLAGQIAAPVEFVDLVRRMHADGVRAFVEVGPGARMTGLVKSILEGREFEAFAFDASSGKRHGVADLARCLSQLASLGYACDLTRWQDGEQGVLDVTTRRKPKMAVMVTGATPTGPAWKETMEPKNFAPAVPASAAPAAPAPAAQTAPAPAPVAYQAPAPMLTEGLLALQRLQEQTAQLHMQFLQSQESTQKTLLALIQQGAGMAPAAYAPAYVPAPTIPAPVAPPPIAPVQAAPVAAAPAPVVQPAPAPVAPAPVAAAPAAGSADRIEKTLLAVVSEKTGYPVETLNLDMGMESDLGIDSIKRVEILSAMRERLPGAPVVGPQHIGQLRTLRQVIEFLAKEAPAGSAPSAAPIAAPVAAGLDAKRVEDALLAVVSEKTGYPIETLNLDMGMESDLGIDSIKRVEILSAMRERLPGAPVVGPQHIGQLRTLRQVIEFLAKEAPAGSAPSAAPIAAPVAAGLDAKRVEDALLAVVSEKTGYPVETLNLDMGMESDLGIDSIKRVEILSAMRERLPEAPVVGPQHIGQLRTLRQVIEYLSAGSAAPAPAPVAAAPAEQKSVTVPIFLKREIPTPVALEGTREKVALPKKALVGVCVEDAGLFKRLNDSLARAGYKAKRIELGSTEIPTGLAGLIVAAPEAGASRLWDTAAESYVKKAFATVQAASAELRKADGILATVTRLDGVFGLGGSLASEPVYGGLAGITKTAAREWTEVACKAIDAAPGMDPTALADAIVSEALTRGPVETGIRGNERLTFELREQEVAQAGAPYGQGDVVLVTGGARGVTAEAAVALAATGATLVLFGRSELSAEPVEFAGLNEGALKKAIAARLGGKASPKQIETEFRAVAASREIRGNLARIERAGGRAVYKAVDVRDAAQVAQAVREARTTLGPVRGLIHGAGVLADRLIADKTGEQFDLVFDTKVAGLRHLLTALDPGELKSVALFSSVTGRFGRVGQVDYAAGNEALNKIAALLAARLKARVVAVDWGPWDGGMVTPALKKVFEQEGAAVIPLKAGAEYLAAELSQASGPVEVVLTAAAGAPAQKSGTVPIYSQAFEREVSVATHPFLESHVINGRGVLPMAVTAEWLGHAALHENPGLKFAGMDGLRVSKGVIVDGMPVRLRALAGKAAKDGSFYRVPVELRGDDAKSALHASAEILLASQLPAYEGKPLSIAAGKYPRTIEQAYSDVLFHGPALRAIEAVERFGPEGLLARIGSAPAPSAWMKLPLRSGWLGDPLALDAAFQLMILWTQEHLGAPCLPAFSRSLRVFRPFPKGGTTVAVRIARKTDSMVVSDIEFQDAQGVVARLEGHESTVDASLAAAFRRNAVAA